MTSGPARPDAPTTGDPTGRTDLTGLNRRRLLRGSAAGLAAALVTAACSSSSKDKSSPPSSAPSCTPTSGPPAPTELTSLALVAGVELAVIGGYTASLAQVRAGRLEALPAALSTFVSTAQSHHQAAVNRWNAVLGAAHQPAVEDPPAALQASFGRLLTHVTHSTGLPRLFLTYEQTASDTYLTIMSVLRSPAALLLAGQLQAVAQEHSALLHYFAGGRPETDAFQDTNLAFNG